ncbi:MAG: hypothetical protein ACI9LM_005548 [Alteromonadaceae bacterium]
MTPPPESESIIWLFLRSGRLIYGFIKSETLVWLIILKVLFFLIWKYNIGVSQTSINHSEETIMLIEVSIGEVVDKVTILEIKSEKIKNTDKLANINREYTLLRQNMMDLGAYPSSEEYSNLKAINLKLWQIEDDIRIKEFKGEFDDEFIQLARSVYQVNDHRANLKKAINLNYGSNLIEEKEYVDYEGTA